MKKIIFSLLLAAVSAFALDINTASQDEFVKIKGIGENLYTCVKIPIETPLLKNIQYKGISMIRFSIFSLLLISLFSGCATKIPNTWQNRVEKSPPVSIKLHASISGRGKPLLMFHGFKGFGNSPKPKDYRYSVYDQAVLVSNYIKEHNLTDITLIGHSYGGGVALSLAILKKWFL